MASGSPIHEESKPDIKVIIESLTVSEKQDWTSPCIFRVPKTLREQRTKAYIPRVITLGPYHFPVSSAIGDEIQLLKTEVTSKMRRQQGDDKFSLVVAMIQQNEKKIRDSYDIQKKTWDLVYIMVPDVCFVLEVLDKFSDKQRPENEDEHWPRVDRILNRKRRHHLLNGIVKDMLKMENQLPLWLLRKEAVKEDRRTFRSVENLKSVGIKFRNRDGGIASIEFDIYNFILYLPHLRIDDRSEVLLRNLILFEITSSMGNKPVTRYVHFMSKLMYDGTDVSILENEGIITNKLRSDEEACELLKCIIWSIEATNFGPIDEAEKGVSIYCERKWQVRWAQFWRIDCSQPWLVISFVAATFLLLLTATQVVCLFLSCNK
eukprot:Gb_17030 [translate_table: standard]